MDPRAGQLFPDSCREEERRAPAVDGAGGWGEVGWGTPDGRLPSVQYVGFLTLFWEDCKIPSKSSTLYQFKAINLASHDLWVGEE